MMLQTAHTVWKDTLATWQTTKQILQCQSHEIGEGSNEPRKQGLDSRRLNQELTCRKLVYLMRLFWLTRKQWWKRQWEHAFKSGFSPVNHSAGILGQDHSCFPTFQTIVEQTGFQWRLAVSKGFYWILSCYVSIKIRTLDWFKACDIEPTTARTVMKCGAVQWRERALLTRAHRHGQQLLIRYEYFKIDNEFIQWKRCFVWEFMNNFGCLQGKRILAKNSHDECFPTKQSQCLSLNTRLPRPRHAWTSLHVNENVLRFSFCSELPVPPPATRTPWSRAPRARAATPASPCGCRPSDSRSPPSPGPAAPVTSSSRAPDSRSWTQRLGFWV